MNRDPSEGKLTFEKSEGKLDFSNNKSETFYGK